MKYGLLLLLVAGASASAMDKQLMLSTEEDKCYKWFVDMQKQIPSTLHQLSDEDREVFNKQIKFQDNPGAVIRSRNNFAAAFYAKAKEANPEQDLPYDEALVKSTFVKMAQIMATGVQEPKTYTQACMWAWGKISKEEQKTFSEDAYLKEPEATKRVVNSLVDIICDKLIEIKLLTAEEKEAKKKELYQERLDRFEKQYKDK
jgi:hypothetical protein